MSIIPINFAVENRKIYLIYSEKNGRFNYALTARHPDGHLCGYLNVDKDDWFESSSEDIERIYSITYVGIGSALLTIPVKAQATIPIQLANYWIGVDGLSSPSLNDEKEMLLHLERVADSVLWGHNESKKESA